VGSAVAAGLISLVVIGASEQSGSGGRRRLGSTPATSSLAPGSGMRERPVGPTARRVSARSVAEHRELDRLIALGLPIYCAGPSGDTVALTFDDGPGPYTRLAIAKLRKHGMRATFFIVGRNIAQHRGVTRSERALGALGDHTFTHPLLTALPPAAVQSELARTQRQLEKASGAPVRLFRPPYGAHDRTIDRIARSLGMLEVLWTVDSRDSLGANYAQIAQNVISGLRPGSIILMHENHGQTIRAMLPIFAAIGRRHLRTASIPELLARDPPGVAQVRAGGRGCGRHPISAAGGG
jgi:peptidoglycan/xylan/chitin deacetylase (PgdA/CDA1 family)